MKEYTYVAVISYKIHAEDKEDAEKLLEHFLPVQTGNTEIHEVYLAHEEEMGETE